MVLRFIFITHFIFISIFKLTAWNDKAIYYKQLIVNDVYDINFNIKIRKDFRRRMNTYMVKLDKQDRIKQIKYLKNNKIATDPTLGVAKVKIDYEDNIERRSYFDKHNKKSIDLLRGSHIVRIKKDTLRNILTVKFKDELNNFIADKYGIHKYIIKTDIDGNIKQLIYCDSRGKVLDPKRYSVNFEHDNKKRIVEQFFADKDGNIVRKSNIVKIRKHFDRDGNLIQQDYVGASGEIIESEYSHIATFKWKYKNGKIVEERVYGLNDIYKEDSTTGVAKTKWKYDHRGNKIEEKYFNRNNKLVDRFNNERFQFAMVRWRYSKKGLLNSISYYDRLKNLVMLYDEYSFSKKAAKLKKKSQNSSFTQ